MRLRQQSLTREVAKTGREVYLMIDLSTETWTLGAWKN